MLLNKNRSPRRLIFLNRRLAAGKLLVAAVLGSGALVGPALTSANPALAAVSAIQGTVVTTGGRLANVRSGPGTGFAVIEHLANGTRVAIVCQTRGSLVGGNWGPTNLWDRLDSRGYISDGLVYTGSNSQVVGSCVSTGPPSTVGGISTTTWYSLVNRNSGKCVDVRGAGTANGTALQQYHCNNTYAQQFQFEPAGVGDYRVSNRNASSQVWGVNGTSTADGASIQLWGWKSSNNQLWLAVPEGNGYYHFVARHSGKCLDVPSASQQDGIQLQQYHCNGTPAQSFLLTLHAYALDDQIPSGDQMTFSAWAFLDPQQATDRADQFAALALSTDSLCAVNIVNGINYPPAKIAVTLVINQVLGGDDPCMVAWHVAWAAKDLHDQRYSNPYFAMIVYRHHRVPVDTCIYRLQVNDDVQQFETIRPPWVTCLGEP